MEQTTVVFGLFADRELRNDEREERKKRISETQ